MESNSNFFEQENNSLECISNCIVPKEIFREANLRENLIRKSKKYISFLDGEIAEIKKLIKTDKEARIKLEGVLIDAVTNKIRAEAVLAENEMLESNYLDKMKLSWQDAKTAEYKNINLGGV